MKPFDQRPISDVLFGGECGPPLPSTGREHPVDMALPEAFRGATGTGLYLNCADHSPALLVLLSGHDTAGTQAQRWDRWGSELGCDVFLVDYPGVGAGVGPASLSAARETSREALRYLIQRPAEEVPSLVIVGRGLGAALAVDALISVPSDRVAGIVLETGPADLVEAYGSQIPWKHVKDAELARKAMRAEFDMRRLLTGLQSPLLVLHPQQDPAIPFDHGERLAQWGGGELAILQRGNRDDVCGLNDAEYRKELGRFLDTHARFEDGSEGAS